MKIVDSDALGVVSKSLGLTGSGAPVTEFMDGVVEQTLDVAPIIRRGRTQASSQGIYTGVMRNIHGAANDQTSAINPFNVTTGAIPPYPAPMPEQFDLWVFGASVTQISGTGTVVAALTLQFGAASQGWGIDSAGIAVVNNREQPVAFWDTVQTVVNPWLLMGTLGPWQRIGMRLPRNPFVQFVFRSTASAIATYELQLLLGVFPVALGQDVIA